MAHPAGPAQADFGEAWAVIGGVTRKVCFFVVVLPHSDAVFVKAYAAETAEAFCDGRVAAFAFFGGVPPSIRYDNTRLAVAKNSWRRDPQAQYAIRGPAISLCVQGSIGPPRQGQTTRARSRG